MNMNYNPYGGYSSASNETLSQYTAKTFGWMFAGLLLTFVTAMATIYSGLYYVTVTGMMPFILGILEIGVVIYLSARIHNLSVNAARGLFFAYSILNGVTLCSLFIYYSASSLVFVFGMTAVYFGIMAAYGALTKTDLSRIRPVLMGGLIALLIMSVLSMFLPIGGFGLCIVGVVLFVAMTAYDTQKIRNNYYYFQGNGELLEKASIFSALQLYLDFINLFLYLLRLFGNRSRD